MDNDYNNLIHQYGVLALQKQKIIEQMTGMESRLKGLKKELAATEMSYGEICNELMENYKKLQNISEQINELDKKWNKRKSA
jgi:predicted  nucleic acid-binding Zn-ribbon protein